MASTPTFSFGHILDGIGDVQFVSNSDVVSCGQDFVKAWKVTASGLEPAGDLDFHTEAIHRLLVTPSGTFLSCGLDLSIAEHEKKAGKWAFKRTLCRSSSPVSAMAVNGKEDVFLGQQDGQIRQQSLSTPGTGVRFTPDLSSAVLALSHHPVRPVLASLARDGILRLWDSSKGKMVGSAQAIGPAVPERRGDGDLSRPGLEWEPQNHTKNPRLALSAKTGGEVLILDIPASNDITTLATLKTKSLSAVSSVRWSPNGQYLAIADCGGLVTVWDMASYEEVARATNGEPMLGASWSPDALAVVMLNRKGMIGVWRSPIPEGMRDGSKVETLEDADRAALFFDDGDKEEEEENWQPKLSKNKKKKLVIDDEDEEEELPARGRHIFDDFEGYSSSPSPPRNKMQDHAYEVATQEAFQPGATPQYKDRAFLSWSLEGTVLSVEEESSHSIQISFSDTSRARQPRITDHYGFIFASLSEAGAIFASPAQQQTSGSKKLIPSTIFFKSFQPWAASNGWNLSLPLPEDVLSVAVGDSFAAAGTTSHFVRIFSLGGVQKDLVSVPGPILCLAASGDLLAVAYHRAAAFGDNQCISFILYDAQNAMCTRNQELSISPGSTLEWLGFMEGGLLCTADSLGFIRVLVPGGTGRFANMLGKNEPRLFGGVNAVHSWVPVLQLPNTDREHMWVIGVTPTDAVVVPCSPSDGHPIPLPHYTPPIRSIELSIPLVEHDDVAGEEKAFRTRLIPTQLAKNKEERMALAVETDKALITLFHSAITDDKLHRARDLAQQLTLPRALSIATKVAGQAKMGQWFVDWLYDRQNEVAKELELVMKETTGAASAASVTAADDVTEVSAPSPRQRRRLEPIPEVEEEDDDEEMLEAITHAAEEAAAAKKKKAAPKKARKPTKKEEEALPPVRKTDLEFDSDEEEEEEDLLPKAEELQAQKPKKKIASIFERSKRPPKKADNVKIQVLDEEGGAKAKAKVPSLFGGAAKKAAPKKKAPPRTAKARTAHPFKKTIPAASKSKSEVLAQMDSDSSSGKKRKASGASAQDTKKFKF